MITDDCRVHCIFEHQLAYTAGDLVAKFVYANVLSDANLMDLWTEQAYRAQLAQKQQANEAQRDFLRCGISLLIIS